MTAPAGNRLTWDSAPAALLTTDLDGLLLEVNGTLTEWTGRERRELENTLHLGDLLTVGGRIYWETHLSPLLHTEGRLDEIALELRGPQGRRPVLLTARRNPGTDRFEAVLVESRERTRFEGELRSARLQSERESTELRALQTVTAKLSSTTGVDALADALLDSARGALRAASARLWVHRVGQGFVPRRGDGPALSPEDFPGIVLRSRTAVELEDRVLVPLHGHDRLRAVLELTFDPAPGDEVPRLELLSALGQQGGLALDRAWQHEWRSGIAHALQQSLLADPPAHDPRYEVAATYRPGVEALEVGGDWYDVFRTDTSPTAPLAVVVGDVVGRGLGAAIVMGQLRSALRAVSGPGVAPAAVLSAMDRFALRTDAAHNATVALAHVDLDGGHVRYACAGHLPPVLLPVTGEARMLWGGRSLPLAVLDDPLPHDEAEIDLAPGDLLIVYTDGLVERSWENLDDSLRALVEAVETVRGLSVHQAVERLTTVLLADEQTRDDVCLLVLRWLGPATA